MIAIICGGRVFSDRSAAFLALDAARKNFGLTAIVHGGARGADSIAGNWAASRGVPCAVYRADWDLFGKAAGHRRNQRMLDESGAEMVLAFPGGAGTADMVRRAADAGLPVMEFSP